MTVDGEPCPPLAAVQSGFRIVHVLQARGMPLREMVRMLDEEWESAYLSACAEDPVYRMFDYL